jgi:glycosyltransferase involved in cell wall biosynthesis
MGVNVDVVVCTYNSEKFLDVCLDSIVKNVPVKKLFIIDNYSVDQTVVIAEKYNAIIVKFKGSLAEARALSFRLVDTDFFVNVDSDVVLCEGWFKKLFPYFGFSDNVGVVWGITLDQHPLHKLYLESMYRIRRAENYNITHLPNMIAKREVLLDIVFPLNISSGSVANEDVVLKRYVEKKGYMCVVAPVFVKHYSWPPLIDRKTFWYGASARLSGVVGFRGLLLRVVFSVPQGLYAALASGEARVLPYWVKFRFQVLYGFLHYSKYYNLKRK